MNNNTAPSGASSSPSLPSQSTPATTLKPYSSRTERRNGKKNTTNPNEYYNVQTQFLIHEEGGLERWFNLTITNVGVESVADYTCVAVNAGGVMEENISLTFEEPEPVIQNLIKHNQNPKQIYFVIINISLDIFCTNIFYFLSLGWTAWG